MAMLIPLGSIITLAGVAALMWCVIIVRRAKAENLSDADMRNRIQRVVAVNMGALFLSAIGLMMVVVGILLG